MNSMKILLQNGICGKGEEKVYGVNWSILSLKDNRLDAIVAEFNP